MTRSIRDLRDIVNISRLSIQDECSSDYSSDGENECKADELFSYLSTRPSSVHLHSAFKTCVNSNRPSTAVGVRITNKQGFCTSRPCSAPVKQDLVHQDRPILKNEGEDMHAKSPSRAFPSKYAPIPPILAKEKSRGFTRPVKNKHVGKLDDQDTKWSVGNSVSPIDGNSMRLTYCDDTQVVRMDPVAVGQTKSTDEVRSEKNIDDVFQYLDGSIIASWLEDSNGKLYYIHTSTKTVHRFVTFAHYILSRLSFTEYLELIELEFSIFVDHLKCGFHSGFNNGSVTISDLEGIAKSLVWEYKVKLRKRTRGPKYLLDIITTFCSGRTDEYRRLLKETHCHSNNKQNIQFILSLRAFGLINFVWGIVMFYEKTTGLTPAVKEQCTSRDEMSSNVSYITRLLIHAVCVGFLDVLDYFYTNHKIDFNEVRDDRGRSLICCAVGARQFEALCYILKLPVEVDVNEKFENGSTPLHCATTFNDVKLAAILLKNGANVNAWNEQAEGATPLHIAVMLGSTAMVEVLLRHGGDRTAVMGVPATITPFSLAGEMNLLEIQAMLTDHP